MESQIASYTTNIDKTDDQVQELHAIFEDKRVVRDKLVEEIQGAMDKLSYYKTDARNLRIDAQQLGNEITQMEEKIKRKKDVNDGYIATLRNSCRTSVKQLEINTLEKKIKELRPKIERGI